MDERFTLSARAQSFRNAFRGIGFLLRHEPNVWLHLAAALAVCALAAALGLGLEAWRWLLAAIAAVFAAETFNSAIEALADALHPAPHPGIGRAKDLCAAAVLIVALGAALIGLLVLGPPLLARLAAWTAA